MNTRDLDFRDLRTVRQISDANPAISAGTLRWWIDQAERNGLRWCVVRIGRTVYVHEPRFNRWLTDHLGRRPLGSE